MVIPKIIHQTWKSDDIPRKMQKYVNSWKKYHPSWKYILWKDEDNDNLVKEHYPQYLELYQAIPYFITKLDMVRLLYLHKYGGIYADLDYECYGSFDDIIHKNTSNLYIIESPFKYNENLQNSLMISNPGNDFWLDCIEYIRDYYNDNIKDKDPPKDLDMILEFGGPRMIDSTHKSKNYVNQVEILPVIPYFKGPKAKHWQAGTWGVRTLTEMDKFPLNLDPNKIITIGFLLLFIIVYCSYKQYRCRK